MGADAAQILGRPVLAGAWVSPRGTTRRVSARTAGGVVGGLVGTATSAALEHRVQTGATALPAFGDVGYLAVSDSEVALLTARTGMLKAKLVGDVVARAPRTDVADVAWDGGLTLSRLSIRYVNGTLWEFEVPRVYRKDAQTAARVLAGATP